MFSRIRARLTPSSIRAQLTLWYLAMLAAALAAFAMFVYGMRAETLYRELDADLEIRERQLIDAVRPSLLELDVAAALAGDGRAAVEPILVRTRSGEILFRSTRFPALPPTDERTLAERARGGEGAIGVRDRDEVAFRVGTIVVDRTGAEPLLVQMATPTAPVRRILEELAAAMALFFVIVLALASYGGSFIARRALAPVDAVVARVRAIQASRLEERLEVNAGSEELDRLVRTLNAMLDRIEASMAAARRFAADASHELQTPIAAMRIAVESSLQQSQSQDDAPLASDLLVELDRISRLVRDLRLLALADAGRLLDAVERVDLSAVASDCCDIARAIAEPKEILVDAQIQPDVAVRGNELHLRRVLLNLLQNATRYSPAGSTVYVSLAPVDRDAILEIADEGCGIAPADVPHIFERFYRADPARARDTGGSGLGLAIADQIARSHGGRIEVSSVLEQGSVFTVSLPLAVD